MLLVVGSTKPTASLPSLAPFPVGLVLSLTFLSLPLLLPPIIPTKHIATTQHMFGHTVAAAGAAAAGPAAVALLQGLVIFGALLYVFGRGAKFSLFKPAEEMVYITLDEDGRTRGKAAIDVVGAQVRQTSNITTT